MAVAGSFFPNFGSYCYSLFVRIQSFHRAHSTRWDSSNNNSIPEFFRREMQKFTIKVIWQSVFFCRLHRLPLKMIVTSEHLWLVHFKIDLHVLETIGIKWNQNSKHNKQSFFEFSTRIIPKCADFISIYFFWSNSMERIRTSWMKYFSEEI